MSESNALARKREIRAIEWREESGLHSERRGFQGGEGGQAKGASLGKVEESMSG